jgi:hypothetical protein
MKTRRRILWPLAAAIATAWPGPSLAAPCVNPGGTGGCFASVQDAIDSAPKGAVISIAAGTYIGTVVVARSLTLQGAVRATTILDGGAAGSVVTVQPRTRVTIQNLTIQNGTGTPQGLYGGTGGGVLGAGRLTLANVTVRDNSTSCVPQCSWGGGGIFFGDRKGRLTVVDSEVLHNQSIYGGGIHVQAGQASIVNSTIAGNSDGGGITDENGTGVRIQVIGSTISGNAGFRPGLRISARGQVTNSTISDNTDTAECVAGVIAGGQVQISFSTIVDNTSTANCSGFGVGLEATGKVSLRGTILANNAGPSDRDCAGAVRSLGSNLVGDLTNCTIQGKPAATLVGVDPDLGPLQDNGGPTETRAPLPGSPVLGVATHCPKTDQRGMARSRPCDIGAVEN